MSAQKKYIAFVVLVIAAFALIYAIEQANLNKAQNETAGPELVNGLLKEPVQENGMTYFVPSDRLFAYGVDVEELHDPKYVSVAEADDSLADNVSGIDLEVEGQHYFYSYQILNWHQIVYATFGNQSLMVTYDPLTLSDRVYVGSDLELGNLVYDNNAVLKDTSGQLWSQQRGILLAGNSEGATLTSFSSRSMTWETWKELYPDGQALSTDTGFVRDYTRHPFGAYDDNDFIYFPLSVVDTRIAGKWITDGFTDGSESIAFVRKIMMGVGAVNATVNGKAIVGMYDQELGLTRVYDSTPMGPVPPAPLTFTYDFDDEVWRDDQTHSSWNVGGHAFSGELKGAQLPPLTSTQQFWFSWATQHTNTMIAAIDTYVAPVDESNEVDVDLNDL